MASNNHQPKPVPTQKPSGPDTTRGYPPTRQTPPPMPPVTPPKKT